MRAENKADPLDPFPEQLELFDLYDDGLSWDEWFRSLPLVPPDRNWTRPAAEEQLSLERAA
jgi:hypothetical protein